jgi:hypothetical protein
VAAHEAQKAFAAIDAVYTWAKTTSEGKAAAQILQILKKYEQSEPIWRCIACGELGVDALCQSCADKEADLLHDVHLKLQKLGEKIARHFNDE